ncbi:peptidyl-prolyl cis-trans isomerase [Microbulbifer litoralis]|uniref:peptidylprolyl isomerase n=1 Tax=Microbulbifer litoralis TaxID=2933965 RepID=UPI002028051F|nr:peptidylprolyl isomerase [Microbulbifer sp. GX H0434]
MSRQFFRDPLFHFIAIGLLLFSLDALFAGRGADRGEIVVSQKRIDHLAAVFQRGWQRPPSTAELRDLVDNYIREEVLYREALNLGLDRDDTVIRRRLQMKMEFLAGDLVDAVEPDDETLRRYFADHVDRYRQPAQFSFRQVYFGPDAGAERVRKALAQLREGLPAEGIGDSTLLQHHYRGETGERLARLFGEGFSDRLRELPAGEWRGPVESAYGAHLVKIGEHRRERTAAFAAVRQRVLRDWQRDEKQKILQAQFDTYRSNYSVRIEGEPEPAAGGVAMQ